MDGWDGWGSPIGEIADSVASGLDHHDIASLGYSVGCIDHEEDVRHAIAMAFDSEPYDGEHSFDDLAVMPELPLIHRAYSPNWQVHFNNTSSRHLRASVSTRIAMRFANRLPQLEATA